MGQDISVCHLLIPAEYIIQGPPTGGVGDELPADRAGAGDDGMGLGDANKLEKLGDGEEETLLSASKITKPAATAATQSTLVL